MYMCRCDLDNSGEKCLKLFANSGEPDQMPQNVASDLVLPCLPITFLGVSRLKWVKLVCTYNSWSDKVFKCTYIYIINMHLHRVLNRIQKMSVPKRFFPNFRSPAMQFC